MKDLILDYETLKKLNNLWMVDIIKISEDRYKLEPIKEFRGCEV